MTTPTLLYETELRIAASPQTVARYFTDPQRYLQWMGRDCELDPRAGGRFRVDINGNDIAQGQFVRVDSERIIFTWGWEGEGHPLPPGASTVEITLTPDGEGTLLRMVHSGFPSEDLAAGHAQGWEHFLPRLVTVAEGGDPGPDAWATPNQEAGA